MLKRMKLKGIITHDFINEDDNMINPYFEFRFLAVACIRTRTGLGSLAAARGLGFLN